ncbi:MAG: methyltransferase domain-containing protein [Cryomorphaceae bacterium]|nr:methyltransferase domain-containing protein [Cryomorphaceae bacterium]
MNTLISIVTRFVPRHYLQQVAHLGLRLISPFYFGNNIEDPINGKTYRKILPYGRITPRENALAPNSLSLERHRLIWLFLKERTNFFNAPHKMLHMAPEYCFLRLFRKMNNLEYVTGDLVSPWADHHFDVHEIPFEDNSFDVLMANHLLEHVEDDAQVMREFYRVMKPGGWGIFQVPIDYSNPKTEEDKSITNPAERERLYWQRDHVRLFGRDYGDRLRKAGFVVTESHFASELGVELQKRYAITPEEIIYFCEKK